ncbi:MAG: response regulator [Phenylobacterium sp.]|uniref:ATP-binding response regulator n=1 Tax=Phenylobacterium sp. TaxID=1871053 RepID=UPI001208A362|nr:hybrid sensor histidine kinase/response regulator [Phenylobacterium sp.]TAJ70201.1 MAG: response regulator [Phenylobacterium sp.]
MPSTDREQAELIRALYGNIPAGALVTLFAVVVLGGGILYMAPERLAPIQVWFAVSAAVCAAQLGLWAWRRSGTCVERRWRTWERRLMVACLADGARWGGATLWLAAPGAADQQVWVCMICGGAVCASVASLGSYARVYYCLLFPAMVPYIVWAAFLPDPSYWGVALLGAILTCAIAWLSHRQSRAFAEAVRLRFENLDLAGRLAEQKALVERAYLAKTRFLAAASHDLRQPMHALGMFVAALSRLPMAAHGQRLTRQIAETVDAMGDLFGSLLDMSQLDAGLIAPEREAFPVGPLLARLCREQAPELTKRPVTLTLVACRATVETDPILLERILRNLIANAVRYTARGRILVGCRRQARRLSVQVWDTGPGVRSEDHERIFEEYYQLGNPERDRAKGLGLGLAITRRLSTLLDCPVELRSWPGKGSVFSVSVPVVAEAARTPALKAAVPPMQDGLIFIIDDEPLVQESMAELLGGWGYEVRVAGSAEDLLRCADPARPPDLLICDWRLRGGETALAAIGQVREAGSPTLPVLLITGDTAPDRLRAAHATGFVLLHKPVSPGKLRAAVGNLIAQSRPDLTSVAAVK